ncbi:thymidine kinase [Equid gammaherpesvirus 2]|uniref:Thymidine kinase n=1 Tax=Equine herpesvirus 2 (strain 86/87) TaxID=82831 RepID=KITH_EHV2|nr:thymidine kinase [Equid gammaherpesvirus 2]Q66624.2 RecName: Full=Thymidine kinase [Equid herpesvirus type 2 strain 86/87]AAC13808.2 thymidine kinase [Equid gammaherpesvirus 2]
MAEGGAGFSSSSTSSEEAVPWSTQQPMGWEELESLGDGGGSTSADEEFQWEAMFVKSRAGSPTAEDKSRTFTLPRGRPKNEPRPERGKGKTPKKPKKPDQGATLLVGEEPRPRLGSRTRSKSRSRDKHQLPDDIYDVPNPPMLAPVDSYGNPVEQVSSSESDFEDIANIRPILRRQQPVTVKHRREPSPEPLGHPTFVHRYDKPSYDEEVCQKKDKGGRTKSKNWLRQPGVKSKLTSMKDLSGSFKSLMHIRSDGEKHKQQQRPGGSGAPGGATPRDVFNTFLGSGTCPSFKNAFFLYLEGSMGVGKTTLIRHMREINGDNVISFVEPMFYWREVYSDCVKLIYSACKPFNLGKMSTSNKVLSAQMKFMTPMKCLQTSVRRYVKANEPLQEKTAMDNWLLFDRHPLSATLVFPYLSLKNGYLAFEHFLALAANFTAHEGDIIALLCMGEEDNLKMVKLRNRKGESGVTSAHLKDLGQAFHACYCTWLLLKYLSPEDMVSVCCCDVTLNDICIMRSMSSSKVTMAKSLFNKSMFPTLMDVIQPFRSNCTIIEICLTLFMELKKVEFIVVNASEFIGDIPGVWTSIYTQSLRTQAIKTQSIDWSGLRAFSLTYNS